MSASITDLWAYVTLRPSGSMGGGEALCFLNGRPLVAASRKEATEMLRLALLTPGPIRLRRFSFADDSGLVQLPSARGDGATVGSASVSSRPQVPTPA